MLGGDYVVVATTYNGGRAFTHRPIPDGPPGHTTISYEDVAPFTDPNSLDA
jgi:erythromycin esterase